MQDFSFVAAVSEHEILRLHIKKIPNEIGIFR
jgi:hypothetical protein